MSIEQTIEQHFQESVATKLETLETLSPAIAVAADTIFSALAEDGKILICGNGGSAADAQHFAAEFIARFERERPSLAALALTTDSSILTAIANDYDFTQVFARQIRGLGQSQDVLIALSTSGHSANILAAIEEAQAREMTVIALTGKGGGQVRHALCDSDIHLCVPSERVARIQETHLLILHCLCDIVEKLLFGE
jgi:D-sedoheptulose 7-phosphate isomerase